MPALAADKILEDCLISTGPTWTTPDILSRYLKEKEGHVNDVISQVEIQDGIWTLNRREEYL